MTNLDWIKLYKNTILNRIEMKTGWGKNDLREEIEKAYQDVLEDMINFPHQKEIK